MADDAYRKLELELVKAREEARRLGERLAALEKATKAPSQTPKDVDAAHVTNVLAGIDGLRQLLRMASTQLSELHAEEVALANKRTRVLADACALLARAVGETGQAPPPIPSSQLERNLTAHPSVDISEVAELIESLRPPAPPDVDR